MISASKVDNLIQRFFKTEIIDKLGRQVLNTLPHLVFLDRNNLKTDLKLTDRQIDLMYERLEPLVRKSDNMFWVGVNGGPVKSGRLLSKDLKTIAIIPTKKAKNTFNQIPKINKIIKSVTKRKLTVVRGHLTDSAVEEGIRSRIIKSEKENTFSEFREPLSSGFTSERADLRKERGKFFKEELNFKYDFKKTEKIIQAFKKKNIEYSGDFIVTITPQTPSSNSRLSGKLEAQFVRKLTNLIKENVLDISSSPTGRKLIEEAVINKFLDNKKNVSKKTVFSSSANIKEKIKVKSKPHFVTFLRDPKGRFTGATKIKNLLNKDLHDQIRSNMGKSTDPPIQLRYQTGRFARSTKVTRVNRVEGKENNLAIKYDFMRFPYDVAFGPGGYLHTPPRDVRKIIGKSIRELAKELVIAKFNLNIRLEGR